MKHKDKLDAFFSFILIGVTIYSMVSVIGATKDHSASMGLFVYAMYSIIFFLVVTVLAFFLKFKWIKRVSLFSILIVPTITFIGAKYNIDKHMNERYSKFDFKYKDTLYELSLDQIDTFFDVEIKYPEILRSTVYVGRFKQKNDSFFFYDELDETQMYMVDDQLFKFKDDTSVIFLKEK